MDALPGSMININGDQRPGAWVYELGRILEEFWEPEMEPDPAEREEILADVDVLAAMDIGEA